MTQAVRELLALSDGWALLGPAPLLRVKAGQEGGPEQEERHGAVAEGRCLVLGLEKKKKKKSKNQKTQKKQQDGKTSTDMEDRSSGRRRERGREGAGRGEGAGRRRGEGGVTSLSLSPERHLPSEKPQHRKTSTDTEDRGR